MPWNNLLRLLISTASSELSGGGSSELVSDFGLLLIFLSGKGLFGIGVLGNGFVGKIAGTGHHSFGPFPCLKWTLNTLVSASGFHFFVVIKSMLFYLPWL